MKLLFLTLISFWSQLVFAEISVDHDWSFDRKTWIRYDYSSGGFLGIGRSRKVFDRTTNWDAPLKYSLSGVGETVAEVGTVGSSSDTSRLILAEGCQYPNDLNNLSCIFIPQVQFSLQDLIQINSSTMGRMRYQILANSISTNRTSKVTTRIDENMVSINVDDYLYSDRQGVRYMKFHGDKIFGNVKINVPLDNKFISFQKKIKADGIFNSNLSPENLIKFSGSNFKSDVDKNTKDKWETVWTLPGQTNYIEIQIGDPSTKVGLSLGIENDKWQNIGDLNIEFSGLEQIIELKGLESFASIDPSIDDLALINNEIFRFTENNINDDNFIDFRNKLLLLVRSNTFKNTILANYSLKDIGAVLDSLNIIGLNNYTEPKANTEFSYVGWDIKTAAYILAVDIAKDSISKLEPFCTLTDFTTSTGEVKKISGLNIASFYVGRAVSRLSNFKFNEFSYLFQFMNQLNQEGLTYAQVRSNDTQIKQIRDVVELLKDANILKKSPFGVAHNELSEVLNNFGDLNGNGMNLSDLLNSLDQINVEVEDLRKEIMLRLRTFQPDNNDVVDFADLEQRVSVISKELNLLSQNIDAVFGINATTFSESGASEDSRKEFINFVVNIVTNHLSIFENITGNLSIDRFLVEYKKVHKVDQLKEKFKTCLPI